MKFKSNLEAVAQFSVAGRTVTLEPGDKFETQTADEESAAKANPDLSEVKSKKK